MAQIQPDRVSLYTDVPPMPVIIEQAAQPDDAPRLFPPLNAFAQHSIEPGEVHLRLIDLADAGWDKMAGFLSVDEELRTARYPTVARGMAYQRARAALRLILAYYARKPPRSLVFDYGAGGKPALRGHPVHFSVGRSENLALIAVAAGPVGVDLEWIGQAQVTFGEQLERLLCETEKQRLQQMTISERQRALCQLWTEKEARRKVMGASAGAHDGARHGPADSGAGLLVHPLDCIPHFAASVCAGAAAAVRWY